MFTSGPTDLNLVLVRNFLEFLHVFAQVGQTDVDRGTERCSQVGGARGDVADVVVVSELGHGLDVLGGAAEALEDATDVSARLHRDDAELVLLVHPHEEGLVVVVENTSVLGPVTVESAGLEEAISVPIDTS